MCSDWQSAKHKKKLRNGMLNRLRPLAVKAEVRPLLTLSSRQEILVRVN